MVHAHPDLPVCVDLFGRLGAEVAAFAEAEAGWQVVTADGPLVPAFTMAAQVRGTTPTVVVVAAAVEPAQLRDTMLAGAVDVVVWPDERERLLAAPERIVRAVSGPSTPLLGVAGARGGAGTSTVALTIAGAVAWAGGRALCVGGAGLLRLAGLARWEGPGTAEVLALGRHAAQEVPALAREVPGVPGLAVLGGGGSVPAAESWPYDLVVNDLGTDAAQPADVMVATADASVEAAAGAGVVLVVEHGPLDRSAVAARLGRAPAAWLPYSNRVARAGCAGRVPSALPGSWVHAVQQGLAGPRR